MSRLHHIIFTERFPDKLVRHALFWVGQFLFWAFMAAGFYLNSSKLVFLKNDLRLHTWFLPDICYCYIVTYVLVPGFLLKGRPARFVLALVGVTLVTYLLFLFFRLIDYDMLFAARDAQLHLLWLYTIKFTSLGPPVICAMFLSLKFLKNYYRKTEETKQLIAENTQSQLGQLKAQIHPHFLFNTLSNIHSFAMSKSPIALELISKLSDTMKYMIYECEAPLVDLGKELKMIGDYMALQSVRYSNALNITMNITGATRNRRIAPLFLIPLVENAFKHGTSQVLKDPWISLDIAVSEHSLVMNLSNSKPHTETKDPFKSGIGLSNVRKRLELLYPGCHRLVINVTEHRYEVEIELPLTLVTYNTRANASTLTPVNI